MKADPVAGILRTLREWDLTANRAASLARVTEADIARIRHADLSRFPLDRLVRILDRLDGQVSVGISLRSREHGPSQTGAAPQ